MFPWLRGGHSVDFPLAPRGLGRRGRAERVRESLAAVGLGGSPTATPGGVYLGDGVLVLSRGPARLVAEIPVALPHPRDQIAPRSSMRL